MTTRNPTTDRADAPPLRHLPGIMSMTADQNPLRATRPISEVVRDVTRWQAEVFCGRDPGATPIGETGWPLSHTEARTYFGRDVLADAR